MTKPSTNTSEPRPACMTRFLGPTDHRGSRVKATHVNTRRSVTLAWDHAVGPQENHERAARAVLRTTLYPAPARTAAPYAGPLHYCSVDGGGYVFMVAE